MEYLIGIGLALGIALFARFVGLDRDRSFYPTVMIVIALTYGLFAVVGNSMSALALESVAIVGFILSSHISGAGGRVLWWGLNLSVVRSFNIHHSTFNSMSPAGERCVGLPHWGLSNSARKDPRGVR